MATAKTTPITLKGKAGFLAWVQKNFPSSVSAPVLQKAQSLNSVTTNVALGRLNAVRRRRRLGQYCCTAAGAACMGGPTSCYSCAGVCTAPTCAQAVACCGSASSCWMSAIGGTLTAAAAAAGVALCSGAVQSNLTAAGQGTVPAITTARATTPGVTVHSSWGGLLFIGLVVAAVMMLKKEDER